MLMIPRYSLIKPAVLTSIRKLVKPLLLLHPRILLVQFVALFHTVRVVD